MQVTTREIADALQRSFATCSALTGVQLVDVAMQAVGATNRDRKNPEFREQIRRDVSRIVTPSIKAGAIQKSKKKVPGPSVSYHRPLFEWLAPERQPGFLRRVFGPLNPLATDPTEWPDFRPVADLLTRRKRMAQTSLVHFYYARPLPKFHNIDIAWPSPTTLLNLSEVSLAIRRVDPSVDIRWLVDADLHMSSARADIVVHDSPYPHFQVPGILGELADSNITIIWFDRAIANQGPLEVQSALEDYHDHITDIFQLDLEQWQSVIPEIRGVDRDPDLIEQLYEREETYAFFSSYRIY